MIVSKYRVISGPHFLVFGLNTESYGENLLFQSEYRKIRIRNNFVLGHFSRSEMCNDSASKRRTFRQDIIYLQIAKFLSPEYHQTIICFTLNLRCKITQSNETNLLQHCFEPQPSDQRLSHLSVSGAVMSKTKPDYFIKIFYRNQRHDFKKI